MELWREKIVASPPSFLNVWDTKECEKERTMMLVVNMEGGAMGIMRSWKKWERKEVGLSWKNKLLKMQSNQHTSWELEARSSNGGMAVVRKTVIMYDDGMWMEGGRGEVPKHVALVRK